MDAELMSELKRALYGPFLSAEADISREKAILEALDLVREHIERYGAGDIDFPVEPDA